MTTLDPAAQRRATREVPGIPCDAEGPVFREPWEAQAFAMALHLYDRGLFKWPEWAAILGDDPQWLYTVVFDSRELWGPDADPALKISIDAFEPYLKKA